MINSQGQVGRSNAELVDAVRTAPDRIDWSQVYCTEPDQYNQAVLSTGEDYSLLQRWQDLPLDLNWHAQQQQKWLMPDHWAQQDIAQLLRDRCNSAVELQRVEQELQLFAQAGLMPLLNYLNYLVHQMQTHQVVLGVGRGSSVSSFVLYKLGVHQINSLEWDLDVGEFFKNQEQINA